MTTHGAITATRFPVRLLTIALVLTAMAFAWLGWVIFDERRDAETFQGESLRIEELRSVIVHLDEVLTMSARMAAATGDPQWEERYRRYEPQLDAAINETIKLGPALRDIGDSTTTDEANTKLVEMENRAFVLVRAGHKVEAQAVLSNPEYEAQKKIYAGGINSLQRQIVREVDKRERQANHRNLFSIIGVLVVLAISFAAWWLVLRELRRWRADLDHAVSERRQAEQALRRAHDELEVRIEQRTAELGFTNRALQAEITERKRAEEAWREIELRLAHAMSMAKLFAWDYDVAGGLLSFSDRYYLLHGTTAELEGGNRMSAGDFARKFVHPDDAHLVADELAKAAATTNPDYRAQLECRIYRRNGELRHVHVSMTCTKDAAGRTIQVHGANQDITERKQAEAERNRLAAILEATTDLVSFSDPAGNVLYYNRAGRNLLGIGLEEDVTKTCVADFIPNPSGNIILTEGVPTAIRQGIWSGETLLLSRSGQEIPVSQVILAHKTADGKLEFLSTIMRDMTESKQTQTELENLHKQLLETSRLGGMAEIATNVLHNVGNVLNSVNVSTGLIVESVKKSRVSSLAKVVVLLREHAQDLGEFITNDSRGKHVPAHLALLSEHLLADQQATINELDMLRRNVEHIKEIVAMQQSYATFGGVKEMINVVDLVEDSLRINEGALGRHRVEVVREFETVPPLNMEKHKILQILVNLVRNAKHACQDSDLVDRRLTVRVANGDGRIRITVIDNGIGIPPENMNRIFNHGFTTRKDGHGFGLHSGALAAKEMGGSLTVHSDGLGHGATFTLELSCDSADATAGLELNSNPPTEASNAGDA